MKTKTISIFGSLILSVAAPAVFAAGHGGGGFGGGHFGGGGGAHFGGGGFRSAPAFSGGSRFSFGARPTFGRPVMVRPQTPVTRTTGRLTALPHQRDSVSSVDRNVSTNSRSQLASRTERQPTERAANHIYARQNANAHRDWDRHGAHYWHRHWWAWDGYAWIGLDDGYYPWDYFPYYAYDYYPYDYYPGYYADVEPYYNNEQVDDSIPTADPTVIAVQRDLAKLGYYKGAVDGLYGRTTRDAVAKYQGDHSLTVTGTLTPTTLQSLGLTPTMPS
jgi:hypothetical protein